MSETPVSEPEALEPEPQDIEPVAAGDDSLTPAQRVLTWIAVGGAMVFVFSQLAPGLLFANTTPAGGDMGAHVWLPAYLRDHLLPHGRLTGWTPDWYNGFPALVFYFPLPSLLIVLLDVILPYGIAFKLVSVSGVVTLPAAAWAFGRLARMRFPGPECLAIAAVPFLFDRSFTIYGGNIPSTLAGEFAFSISLSVSLVFLGVVARGLETGKHRGLAAVLLAVTALCHVVPAFFALAGLAALLIFRLDRHRLSWVFPVGAISALLAAFWVLPFLARIAYTNDMGWEKLVDYRHQLLPSGHLWLQVLAAIGAVLALARRRRTASTLAVLAVVSAAGFILAPQSRLWNARLLPFWFLCLYLLAGVAIAEGARLLGDAGKRFFDLEDAGPGRSFAEMVAPLCALTATLMFVAVPLHVLPGWVPFKSADRSFIPDWVRWNYTGYERKTSYPEYSALIKTMEQVGDDHGCGRAMWEYEPQLDRLGTPMALMLLPYWTKGCIGSMEGLFFESSATTPYHFLNQSELSQSPSRAQRDLPYRSLDLSNGVSHLQLMGVRYYMAISDEAKQAATAEPALKLLETSGPWDVNYDSGTKARTWAIYEVAESAVVAPLAFEPVVMNGVPKGGREWLDAAVAWYQEPSRWDVPLAASGPSSWQRVEGASATPPRSPVVPAKVTNIRMTDDRISFDVDRVGSPVLVKASYFPNFQASGAKGPWRVTPNLMVVIPTSKHVSVHYGHTPVDLFSWLLTLIGIAGLVWMARRPALVFPEPPPPPPAADDEPLLPTLEPPELGAAEPVFVGHREGSGGLGEPSIATLVGSPDDTT